MCLSPATGQPTRWHCGRHSGHSVSHRQAQPIQLLLAPFLYFFPIRFCSSGDRCVCVHTSDCVPACPAEHPGRLLVTGPTQHTTSEWPSPEGETQCCRYAINWFISILVSSLLYTPLCRSNTCPQSNFCCSKAWHFCSLEKTN